MPARLNGLDVVAWTDAPTDTAGWAKLATQQHEDFTEPPMTTVPGKFAASGVVILERDARVWVVSPINQYGGYVNTFPKGKLDLGLGLRANALMEAFEESGLQVELTGFLCDSVRSTSITRYYTAKRVGGHPGDTGLGDAGGASGAQGSTGERRHAQNDQGVLEALAALS